MKKGTLQDLREGRIPVSSAERLGQPSPIQRSSFETSSDGLEKTAERKSHERQTTSENDRAVILNLEYGSQHMPSNIQDNGLQSVTKSDKSLQPVIKSEDRDKRMLSNVGNQPTKQEFPAIILADDDPYESDSDSDAVSNSDTDSNESDMDGKDSSEDDDAMMRYSKSEQIATDEAERNEKATTVSTSHEARILADLSLQDLNAQLRYFHTSKIRDEVDGETPVRCLVCAKEGHMAGLCEYLTCSTCGAFNQHTTHACPTRAKCGKCREQGHDKGHCPYKLRKMPVHEIVCDLCERNGHIEEDCELIWRTSGRPSESELAPANVRLSCYECGHSDHLGNNCPSRKPSKPTGTSTWDGNRGSVSIKSTREIKIKGKATQQNPINLDDSDDERANFYRPRISVPGPVRKGQIRIITDKRESPVCGPTGNERQAYTGRRHDSFAHVNDTYRQDEARQPHQQYRDRGRGDWRAGDGQEHATGYGDLRYKKYRPNERRSRSPRYRDYAGYAGEISRPPPRPEPRAEHHDRRPPADKNVYRPMPSAAQNAWIRRRL